ncbi:MAG: MjaI family restriction endonuclease [candidate division KSB1 bacterium]|nr:MjaI family restriction endonuclease [candidate division KSB1 bacterium]
MPDEENKGIDGYIGKQPVSIKPTTYQAKQGSSEQINVPIFFYSKKKNGIVIEFDEKVFNALLSN